MPSFNDIDLKNWKNSEIATDSLWIIPERDKSGKHDGYYHGNFVPQIPRQLISRYTKKDDVVFDPFVGSGTTAFECETLKRNFIGIDIQETLINQLQTKVDSGENFTELLTGDSTDHQTYESVKIVLSKHEKKEIQLAILHPPYADIIQFSENPQDLSNAASLEVFLNKFSKVMKYTIDILQKGRYLIIVMGDKYTKGEWVPLGFYCMQEAQKLGLTLKSVVVKNMEGNRAKKNQQSIWRYRALSSDYYIFKHEYVFILKKTKE